MDGKLVTHLAYLGILEKTYLVFCLSRACSWALRRV